MSFIFEIYQEKKWNNPTENQERCPYCGENVLPHLTHVCQHKIEIYQIEPIETTKETK